MEANEDSKSIAFQTEQFENKHFNTEESQLFIKRRRNEEFDLVIVYKDSKSRRKSRIKLHKELLQKRSWYFETMMNPKYSFKEEEATYIYFEFSMEFNVFKTFIDYIYSGMIELQGRNVFNVYLISSYINQRELAEYCIQFLSKNITCKTIPQIRAFANSNKIKELTDAVQDYTDKNFNDVVYKSADVLQWPYEDLTQAVSSTKMKVKREENVLQVVCKWLNSDFEKRKHFMQELFTKLRFSFMSTEDIQEALQEDSKEMNSKILELCSTTMTELQEKLSDPNQQVPPEEPRQYYEGIYIMGSRAGSKDMVFEHFWPKNKNLPVKSLYLPSVVRVVPNVTVLNGKLYLSGGFGGDNDEFKALKTVEVFDPTENEWSIITPMNIARSCHMSCSCNGKLYAFGGMDRDAHSEFTQMDSEVYDPKTNKWSIISSDQINKLFEGKKYEINSVATVKTSIFLLYANYEEQEAEFCLLEFKPHSNEWTKLQCPEHLKHCGDMIGYDSMLCLFSFDGTIVIYDTKCQTFHKEDMVPEDYLGPCGVFRFRDKILLGVNKAVEIDELENDEGVIIEEDDDAVYIGEYEVMDEDDYEVMFEYEGIDEVAAIEDEDVTGDSNVVGDNTVNVVDEGNVVEDMEVDFIDGGDVIEFDEGNVGEEDEESQYNYELGVAVLNPAVLLNTPNADLSEQIPKLWSGNVLTNLANYALVEFWTAID